MFEALRNLLDRSVRCRLRVRVSCDLGDHPLLRKVLLVVKLVYLLLDTKGASILDIARKLRVLASSVVVLRLVVIEVEPKVLAHDVLESLVLLIISGSLVILEKTQTCRDLLELFRIRVGLLELIILFLFFCREG